jgi:hypothetical protein
MCAAIVALVALSASAGCAFSSYHSAKMLPQGATRVGGGISFYSLQANDGSGDTQGYELAASHGFSDKLELGGKFSYSRESDDNFDISVNYFNLLVSPKFSLMPDKLALTAETGINLVSSSGDGVETENIWLTMPGIVFTQHLNEMFDLNLAGKAVLMFQDDFGDHNFAFATNIGIRLLVPESSVVIFPELGFMFDDDDVTEDGGYFMQFGVAVQYTFGGAPAAPPAPPAPTYMAPPPPPPAEPLPPPPADPVPPPTPAPAPTP